MKKHNLARQLNNLIMPDSIILFTFENQKGFKVSKSLSNLKQQHLANLYFFNIYHGESLITITSWLILSSITNFQKQFIRKDIAYTTL